MRRCLLSSSRILPNVGGVPPVFRVSIRCLVDFTDVIRREFNCFAVISASSIEARRTARWVSLVSLTASGSSAFRSSTNSFSSAASSSSLAASRLISPILLSCSAVKVPALKSNSRDCRGPTKCDRTAVLTAAGIHLSFQVHRTALSVLREQNRRSSIG